METWATILMPHTKDSECKKRHTEKCENVDHYSDGDVTLSEDSKRRKTSP